MKKSISNALLTLIMMACIGTCYAQTPPRPKITGVAHAAFLTKDYTNTTKFYTDFLGYENPISLSNRDGSPMMTFVKINDRQWVELFPEKEAGTDRLYHFGLETDDAEAMRLYLAAKGYNVPKTTPKGKTGNSNYFVTDPNGTICEFVQYNPEGLTVKNFGKNMPSSRIATMMSHVGFMVADLDKALGFYCDVLGFKEIWRGGKDPAKVTWVHLQVPEGTQTIELMLYEKELSKATRGVFNHICLEVDSVPMAIERLSERHLPQGCKDQKVFSTGVNKKRQINCYDTDATRVEIMEKNTVDGTPAPSSKGVPLKFVPKTAVAITE